MSNVHKSGVVLLSGGRLVNTPSNGFESYLFLCTVGVVFSGSLTEQLTTFCEDMFSVVVLVLA